MAAAEVALQKRAISLAFVCQSLMRPIATAFPEALESLCGCAYLEALSGEVSYIFPFYFMFARRVTFSTPGRDGVTLNSVPACSETILLLTFVIRSFWHHALRELSLICPRYRWKLRSPASIMARYELFYFILPRVEIAARTWAFRVLLCVFFLFCFAGCGETFCRCGVT